MTSTARRISFTLAGVASLNVALYAANSKPWKVPEAARKVKNPINADAASIDAGKKIYVNECLDCHGRSGQGDGPGAKDLERRPPSLRFEEFQEQTDGTLFYKITRGRGEMPSYRRSLSDEQRWHTVNYIRTFADVRTARATEKR